MAPRNIILTGFMGTGKSTVGQILAELLEYEFVDTDTLIEQRHGDIPTIFRVEGELAFRRYERVVATELSNGERRVIGTGGRLMLDETNAQRLGQSGRVFCLSASIETILARVTTDDQIHNRPLIAGPHGRDRVAALLAERADGYAQFESINTDSKTPTAVAQEIVGRLKPGC